MTIEEVWEEVLNEELLQMIFSNARAGEITKVKIRPVLLRDQLHFQKTEYIGTKVFHENLDRDGCEGYCRQMMEQFKQCQILCTDKTYSVLISKKGKVTISVKKGQKGTMVDAKRLMHNRKKQYLLEEGEAVPFLQDLGVMTKEGKIVRTKYDKYRQINRFLEFIEDIVPKLANDREITIIDFGCGKSYLTFAIYYYLHEKKHLDVKIIGLDLKEDVITHCNQLKEKYGYEKLQFLKGDIAHYEGVDHVDMVVTLHACDTATDYALLKAIAWDAKVILSVPCCQHEVNAQIKNQLLQPVLDYGILKERMSAIITDGLRAKKLESCGYDTQILEFIDMDHTPKNLLIRAVKNEKKSDDNNADSRKARESVTKEARQLMEQLQITPTIWKEELEG